MISNKTRKQIVECNIQWHKNKREWRSLMSLHQWKRVEAKEEDLKSSDGWTTCFYRRKIPQAMRKKEHLEQYNLNSWNCTETDTERKQIEESRMKKETD